MATVTTSIADVGGLSVTVTWDDRSEAWRTMDVVNAGPTGRVVEYLFRGAVRRVEVPAGASQSVQVNSTKSSDIVWMQVT